MNQLPLSLIAMKRSPLEQRRMPDSPPKRGNDEVSTSPLRYCSEPKRRRVGSPGSKDAMGLAFTSIDTGAVRGRPPADLPRTHAGARAVDNPAADMFRNQRRDRPAGTAFTNAGGGDGRFPPTSLRGSR